MGVLRELDKLPYKDRKDRNPERLGGTCEWFTNHEIFQTWQESRTSSFLWVSADPGCGKSVLARYLVDEVLPSTSTRTTCYFFFKDDFEDQRSPIIALCCILRQLFEQNPAFLSDKILEKFRASTGTLTSNFHSLWEILISIASDQNSGEIICILDALDECEKKERSQLTGALHKLYLHGTRTSTLKFLLTSRPYIHIQRDFQVLENRLPTIHLSGENEIEVDKISREIDIFIKNRVKNLSEELQLLPEEEQTLQQELIQIPQRTYLWVYLIFNVIRDSIYITKDSLLKDICTLPKTVETAYDKILCWSGDQEMTKRILHIVVAAERPLSLSEMALALAIKEGHQTYADLKLEPESRFRHTVRELCGLFVIIVDSKIYLLHQTAKEFLVKREASDVVAHPNHQLRWKFSLQPEESHRILADICILHLLFEEFESSPLSAGGRIEHDTVGQYTDDHVFLDYSAKHWVAHCRATQIEGNAPIQHSMLRLFYPSLKRGMTWYGIYKTALQRSYPSHFCPLIVASYLGLETIVRLVLLQDADVESRDDDGRTPLSYAAEGGHEAIVMLLLETDKINADSKDVYGNTPLLYAAREGYEAIVKLLLGIDSVNPDLKNGSHYYDPLLSGYDDSLTPFLYPAGGHEDIVQLLLQTGGASARSRGPYDYDPFFMDDDNGRTPLSYASEKGYETIVSLLLETDRVNAYSKSYCGETPLSYAAKQGHESILRLLLKSSAEDF